MVVAVIVLLILCITTIGAIAILKTVSQFRKSQGEDREIVYDEILTEVRPNQVKLKDNTAYGELGIIIDE